MSREYAALGQSLNAVESLRSGHGVIHGDASTCSLVWVAEVLPKVGFGVGRVFDLVLFLGPREPAQLDDFFDRQGGGAGFNFNDVNRELAPLRSFHFPAREGNISAQFSPPRLLLGSPSLHWV